MQIFQTNSSTRWTRFKWIICFALLAVIVSATVLIVALQQVYTPALPRLNNHTAQLTKWLPDNHTTPSCKNLAPGFQKYITAKEKKAARLAPFGNQYQIAPPPPESLSRLDGRAGGRPSFNRFPCGIRSAFM